MVLYYKLPKDGHSHVFHKWFWGISSACAVPSDTPAPFGCFDAVRSAGVHSVSQVDLGASNPGERDFLCPGLVGHPALACCRSAKIYDMIDKYRVNQATKLFACRIQ